MGTFTSMADEKVSVEVGGRRLTLSNLSKILYPPGDGSHGFSKAEVVDYYTRVSPVLLPHLAGRPATFIRFPDGVEGKSFFEKNAPSHTPDWVRTVTLPSPGSGMKRDTIDYVIVADLPTLVWAANLASLELHVPQWAVAADGTAQPADLLVLDLDPGPPATVVECSQVAVLLRERLAADSLVGYPKTSGSKGMQMYVALEPTSPEAASRYAKTLAEDLERSNPGLVVSRMAKEQRTGKVFVDWSQNNGAKTTVAPYSLRARRLPTVSTPVTWEEVEACRKPEDLVFTAPQVLERVERHGDLLAPLLGKAARKRAGKAARRGRLPVSAG
jgi:bifunctional non-homologous end joining protein LigD